MNDGLLSVSFKDFRNKTSDFSSLLSRDTLEKQFL